MPFLKVGLGISLDISVAGPTFLIQFWISNTKRG
jgi:hypothetical protein